MKTKCKQTINKNKETSPGPISALIEDIQTLGFVVEKSYHSGKDGSIFKAFHCR